MNCPNCSQPVQANTRFCVGCGQKIDSGGPAQPSADMGRAAMAPRPAPAIFPAAAITPAAAMASGGSSAAFAPASAASSPTAGLIERIKNIVLRSEERMAHHRSRADHGSSTLHRLCHAALGSRPRNVLRAYVAHRSERAVCRRDSYADGDRARVRGCCFLIWPGGIVSARPDRQCTRTDVFWRARPATGAQGRRVLH